MRYQKVFTQIWNDEKFRKLNAEEQRFYLYVLSSPHSNLIGFYVLRSGYACADLKYLQKDFNKNLRKCVDSGFLLYDFENETVLVKNYLKHNPITNRNQLKAAVSAVASLPKTLLINTFLGLTEGLNKGLNQELHKELMEGHRYSVTEEEEVTEEEKDSCQVCLDDGSTYSVPSDLLSSFKKTYKNIDVEKTIGEIAAWNLANPSKRKTRSGIVRHINGWLKRENDRVCEEKQIPKETDLDALYE